MINFIMDLEIGNACWSKGDSKINFHVNLHFSPIKAVFSADNNCQNIYIYKSKGNPHIYLTMTSGMSKRHSSLISLFFVMKITYLSNKICMSIHLIY